MCGTGTRTDRSQLTSVWKKSVIASFDRAAGQYDNLAQVQRAVAKALSKQIVESVNVTEAKTAFEIGCGSGFLTKPMLNHFSTSDWLVSDVSPKMIEACRSQLGELDGDRKVDFRVLDGEVLSDLVEKRQSFDLICSSLAFQWFADLPKALSGILGRLNEGGQLHFATLADSNFCSLYDHFPMSGLEQRAPKFPAVSEIEAALIDAGATEIQVSELRYSEAYPNLRSFLDHLKSIGAATAGTESMPENKAALRNAIKESNAKGHRVIADYHVLIVSAKRAS